MSLDNPTAIIALFDDGLHDSSKWPSDDHAAKQHIYVKKPSPQQVIKTGWSMTLMMRAKHNDHQMQAVQSDCEVEEEDYQMVGIEMSSEASSAIWPLSQHSLIFACQNNCHNQIQTIVIYCKWKLNSKLDYITWI
jgi:hypothetical protein